MCEQNIGDLEADYVKKSGKSCPIEILNTLRTYVVESRPIWKPMHMQPIYKDNVFITKNGTPVNRCNVWAEMKALCKTARVSPEKVFPHNLRHLFAVTYYRMQKDIVHLADILGHSNIEYTRIYTFTSEEEHARVLSRMCLLI